MARWNGCWNGWWCHSVTGQGSSPAERRRLASLSDQWPDHATLLTTRMFGQSSQSVLALGQSCSKLPGVGLAIGLCYTAISSTKKSLWCLGPNNWKLILLEKLSLIDRISPQKNTPKYHHKSPKFPPNPYSALFAIFMSEKTYLAFPHLTIGPFNQKYINRRADLLEINQKNVFFNQNLL